MKNLKTSDNGLIELSHEEQKEITGGSIFLLLGIICGIVAAVAALIDYAQKQVEMLN